MHDSHEFLTLLLDGLLKANLSGAPKAEGAALEALERRTLQHHLFGGTLLNVIQCSGCAHKISRAERVVQLELAVNKLGEEPQPQTRGIGAWVRRTSRGIALRADA